MIDWDQKPAVQMTLSNSAPMTELHPTPPPSTTPIGRPIPSSTPVTTQTHVTTSVSPMKSVSEPIRSITEPKVEPAEPPNTINTAPPQMEPIVYDTQK